MRSPHSRTGFGLVSPNQRFDIVATVGELAVMRDTLPLADEVAVYVAHLRYPGDNAGTVRVAQAALNTVKIIILRRNLVIILKFPA